MDTLYSVSFVITVLGAIQWGLIGLGGFIGKNINVISFLSRGNTIFEYSIYLGVGIFGVCYLWISTKK